MVNKKHRGKKKIENIILIILVTSLFVVLLLGYLKNKKISKENQDNYEIWQQEKESEEMRIKDLNFYEKLKSNKSVKILVLGDDIGLSKGKGEKSASWTEKLSSWIKEEYAINADIKNLSIENATTKDGLNQLIKDNNNFDLAITVYGDLDKEKLTTSEFGSTYEDIIMELKKRNNNCDIIMVVENTFKKNDPYVKVVKNIGNNYDLNILDTIEGFIMAKEPYEELVTHKKYPNDVGYDIYVNGIKNIIKTNIDNNRQITKERQKSIYK